MQQANPWDARHQFRNDGFVGRQQPAGRYDFPDCDVLSTKHDSKVCLCGVPAQVGTLHSFVSFAHTQCSCSLPFARDGRRPLVIIGRCPIRAQPEHARSALTGDHRKVQFF